MQDPDLKCRHFGILWPFMAFWHFCQKVGCEIIFDFSDLFRFLDFSRLSDSTALVLTASILSSAMKSNLVEKPAAVAAAPKSNSSSSQKVKK